MELPLKDYPVLLMLPIYDPPGKLGSPRTEPGVHIRGTCTVSFGKKPAEVCLELGADDIRIEHTYRPAEFARMIAKIAYSWAVAEHGLPSILDSKITRIIRGVDGMIGDVIGNVFEELTARPGLLHRFILEHKGALLAHVQLFANSPSPTYTVVLGEAKLRDS